MEKLLEENKKLIYCVMHRLDYIPEKIDKEDLYQIGYIALWDCLQAYDEVYGLELSTYCYNKIKAKMIDYLRSQQAVKRRDVVGMDCDKSFEEEINLKMLLHEIRRVLPEDMYCIFIDKYMHKYTIHELTEKYKLTKSKVEYKLKKAKQQVMLNIQIDEWRKTYD